MVEQIEELRPEGDLARIVPQPEPLLRPALNPFQEHQAALHLSRCHLTKKNVGKAHFGSGALWGSSPSRV